jgi:hypothetical protein
MTACYRKLDWPGFDSIQKKLIPLVLDMLERDSRTKFMNLFTEEENSELKNKVPELFETFSDVIKGDIEYLRIIYLGENFPTHSVAHTDFVPSDFKDGVVPHSFYRLNWPILNAESYETLFFRSNVEPQWREDKENKMSGYTWLDSEVELIDSVISDAPTLIDVRQIHGFRKVANRLPRILLTFRPSNGDSDYLKNLVERKS